MVKLINFPKKNEENKTVKALARLIKAKFQKEKSRRKLKNSEADMVLKRIIYDIFISYRVFETEKIPFEEFLKRVTALI